jgi:FHA domain-containing protein
VDPTQILLTTAVGLSASIVTAYVTYTLNRRQERRRHEREIAAKLAEMPSTRDDATRIFAVQFANACLVLERSGEPDRDRIFLPAGSRITLGRASNNHIVVDDIALSRVHLAFRASGGEAFVEPLGGVHEVLLNGASTLKPMKLKNGDVISVSGASFTVTYLEMTH